ncbi:MAG: EAL domain-containing protein [Kangiellaceae bacterium]|jgi:diguanylate cyclase (GGDEF)-like protein|nr:EAL domain-containing protein [Kangiellaceae bacterium]
MNPRLLVIFLYTALTLLGAGLSLFLYQKGQEINQKYDELIQQKVPQLSYIADLNQKFTEYEQVLYEFYSSPDENLLNFRLESLNEQINSRLTTLQDKQLPARSLEKIAENHKKLMSIARELRQELSTITDQSWDNARAQLELVRAISKRNKPFLEGLTSYINEELDSTQKSTADKLQVMILWVGISAILILVIAIISGFQITTRLKEAKEKKRLALFVERNPNPVASLDWQGQVRYKNPSWRKLQSLLVSELLPSDLPLHINRLKDHKQINASWTFRIETQHFQASLHKQDDLQSFNLYLEDITQRRKAENELEFLAFNDPLTGLSNRRKLEIDADNWLDSQPEDSFALIVMGIDRFSQVTASHGFNVGDQIILSIRDRLINCIHRFKDDLSELHLYRFTGAKFVVLYKVRLPHNVQTKSRQLIAHIQDSMLMFINNSHGHFYLNLTFGSAFYPDHGTEFTRLLQDADTAYTLARRNGGNTLVEYDKTMSDKEKKWLDMEVDLRLALGNKELSLVYQPKVCSFSKRITGVEALVRWIHPEKGFISPADFIPVAEQSGLIIEIGEWILSEACKQTLQWQRQGLSDLVCAVNISPMQFIHHGFMDMVLGTLRRTGLSANSLELEITEGVLMNDVENSTKILKQLHTQGMSIAIDDFGTGYSSLSYLKLFALDKLKIDKSFVDNITDSSADLSITKTVISLAKNLNLKVIAEGVETEDQFLLLKQLQCDEIQGYYFSRPLAADEINNFKVAS